VCHHPLGNNQGDMRQPMSVRLYVSTT
jgi:hypothetical protein